MTSNPPDILAVLDDLHAPIRVPGIGEYQYACGRAALEIRKLRQRRAADRDVRLAEAERIIRSMLDLSENDSDEGLAGEAEAQAFLTADRESAP